MDNAIEPSPYDHDATMWRGSDQTNRKNAIKRKSVQIFEHFVLHMESLCLYKRVKRHAFL